jgi:hypothetical protein
MAKPFSRRGLQHKAAINCRHAFDIFGQAKRAREIELRRRIEAQNKPVPGFLGPIANRGGPIHHHPTIGRMCPDPKPDYGCLLRKS